MRKPLVAGNWKMNGSSASVQALVSALKPAQQLALDLDLVLIPSFVHLELVHTLLKNSKLGLGAQNLHCAENGAFTGEISGPMLVDLGCQYVLVGHSERRALFGESSSLVADKFQAALKAGLTPILCVGETLEIREKGETEKLIREQLSPVIAKVGIQAFAKALIAYEPVWAIGTGVTATPEQAQAVHNFIRQLLNEQNVEIAQTIRILYGGSLKADNASELFAMPDIDGGLVGGASLDAKSFLAICEEAVQAKQKSRKIGQTKCTS